MQGDADAARALYKMLLRIDPHDTVAKYYLNQSKHVDAAGKRANAKWIIPYQVPFSEAFRRLNHLNRMLVLPHDELNHAWANDVSFGLCWKWAISLSDLRVKRSMLSLVFTFADENAQTHSARFFLRTDTTGRITARRGIRQAKTLGAREPYMAYLNGTLDQRPREPAGVDYKLPASYEGVMQI
jgi:hypothetical protein